MLYRSIYIGNPAHLKLKDKQLKITDPTTQTVPKYAHALLSITKLQNLKAIHNLRGSSYYGLLLLSITKLQNLKAIHNWYCYIHYCLFCCYQSQNYKI